LPSSTWLDQQIVSHGVVYGSRPSKSSEIDQAATAKCRGYPDKKDAVNRQGLGLGEGGDPSPTVSSAFVPGVAVDAFQPRIGRNGRGDMGDLVNALTMSG
jgi:hypothetical protein